MYRRTRVKICGVCSADDAAFAVAAGADAVGVVLAESARRLTIEEAEVVLASVPPLVARVGVFVDADPGVVARTAARLRLSFVQLCGAESPAYCAAMPVPAVKVFHVGEDFDASSVDAYVGSVAAAMLDTQVVGMAGGTGRTFDWEAPKELPDSLPVVVSGGLNAGNVGEAIRILRPFGVDVSSGVEARPRHKDPDAVERFLAAVRAADEGLSTQVRDGD
jgi:phosphoribosylanthranilate isomerase